MSVFRIFLIIAITLIISCSARSAPGIDYQNPSFADIPVLIPQMISSQDMELQNKAGGAIRIILNRDGGLEAIVDLLETGDSQQRRDTAVFIGFAVRTSLIQYIQEPHLLPALNGALTDEDEGVRETACSAIGDVIRTGLLAGNSTPLGGDTEATIQVLMSLLNDTSPDVQVKASNTLAYLGPSAIDAVGDLKSLLANQDFLVRLGAATALAKIDPDIPDGVSVLTEGALSPETDYRPKVVPNIDWVYPADVHRVSAQALALIGPPAISAVPALLGLFCDPDSATQDAAVSAAFAIDPTGEAAVPALIELLSDECSDARGNSARTLILIGPPGREAIPALQNLLEDPDGWVREQASQAIAAIQAG